MLLETIPLETIMRVLLTGLRKRIGLKEEWPPPLRSSIYYLSSASFGNVNQNLILEGLDMSDHNYHFSF